MANRRFGKLGDVWKHLVLVELLSVDQPLRYGETHAGSGAYRMVDDAERRFGVMGFLDVADTARVLADSRYAAHLRHLMADGRGQALYPGSSLLAMLERGAAAEYLLCDVDRSSIEDLHGWSDRLDLNEQVHIVAADGMSMIDAHFASPMPPHRSLVHIDPFDPHHKQSGGRSAVELAGELVSAGVGLLYWYGYDDPKSRAWPLADLIDHDARSLWCGDILIVDETGGTVTGGDLGAATTPGTGFGVVAANVSDRAIRLCTDLGQALAATYRDSTLPNGSRGHIDFLHVASSD